MAHSLANVILHIVFSTKKRECSITDSLRPRLHAYLAKLVAYIENQEEHHKTLTFQEEYRALLRKNGIVVDETYLWD
jgi:hypothetical protein